MLKNQVYFVEFQTSGLPTPRLTVTLIPFYILFGSYDLILSPFNYLQVHDKFCWECHNILDSFSALECSSCNRSFDQCHEDFWVDFDTESWLCPVCAKMESNANAAE